MNNEVKTEVTPCKCGNVAPLVATNIDGKWFVKCQACGATTINYRFYESAVMAWRAGAVNHG